MGTDMTLMHLIHGMHATNCIVRRDRLSDWCSYEFYKL